MKLFLRIGYTAYTGVQIAPGEYDADDAKLHGLAGYLLENGHAVTVDAPPVEPAEDEPAEAPAPRRRK